MLVVAKLWWDSFDLHEVIDKQEICWSHPAGFREVNEDALQLYAAAKDAKGVIDAQKQYIAKIEEEQKDSKEWDPFDLSDDEEDEEEEEEEENKEEEGGESLGASGGETKWSS